MPSFTADAELDLLFPANLIPDSVKKALPQELHLRPLSSTDYHRGHLKLLTVLTQAPDTGYEQYFTQFSSTKAIPPAPQSYFTIVIVNRANDSLVGVGTVFLERKFIRGLGTVGHIEDIAVDKSMQGKKLGLRIIEALTAISERMGAYKTILNCSEANIPFYKKCGYELKEVEMVKYAPPQSTIQKL
ncbi:hypothetical protein BOTBODRAFT_35203 [Botryobasidium botryosum FD-172 SS1]|uniref:Glucosamine 6-phosphate N-acetyltransferase n=1 Tax=Botryobasidium botryosum (strain FD-172 SS1) TaxID=930990 RepID=A0A067MIY3_BOTB1|nr:hypothetical protein BOTBODRAFT_35203 [Botryobasidium botryosum FD-172 SS1]